MYRRLTLIIILAACLLVLVVGGAIAQGFVVRNASETAAAVGTAFTYQGRLMDGSDPATGFYDFEFLLYDALSGGSQVGSTISLENEQVTDGLFTVALDFGDVFDGTALWLEIAVRLGTETGAYTTLSPRQALTPAPYALYAPSAGHAETADSADSALTASAAPWSGLTGVPAGFADNVDNDTVTTYSAGTGLSLVSTQFSLDTAYTDGRYWSQSGNAGTNPSTDFLGTTDAVTLTIGADDTAVMEVGPDSGTPSVMFPVNAGDAKEVQIGERFRDNAIIAWAKIADTYSQLSLSEDYGVASLVRCDYAAIGCYVLTLTDEAVEGGTIIPIAIAEVDEDALPNSAANARILSINQIGDGASAEFHVYIVDGTFTFKNNDFVFIVTGR